MTKIEAQLLREFREFSLEGKGEVKMTVGMLDEFDVGNYVCTKLQAEGYCICQRLYGTNQQGDDIIAVKQVTVARRLYVEVKGETSSQKCSARYGKRFDSADIGINVAEAFYKAAEVLSRERDENVEVRAGIALPDNKHYCNFVEKIKPILDSLDIAVFWVDQNGSVRVTSTWRV